MTKTVAVLWLTLAATLAASWTHLVQVYARHEWPEWWPVACLAATAIDLGILVSLMAVSDLAAEGRETSGARHTAYGLTALSSLANIAHVVMVGGSGSTLELALAVVTAAALPAIVWRLSLLLDALRRPGEVAAAPASKATRSKPAKAQPQAATATGSAGKWHAAIARHGADNSLSELARLEGVSRQAVSQWKAAANGREVTDANV